MGGGMVGGGGVGKRAELYEGRITSYFLLACVIGSLGGSLFGYDLGVSSGVTSMDDFLVVFFPAVYRRKQEHLHETDYCKYDDQVLTLFTSALYIAALFSTFAASFLTRRRGRTASILFGSVSFFLGGSINAAAVNIPMLIAGRILLGVGIGFGNQAVPLYLSEIAPPKIRGAVNQLFQLTTCLGVLVADFINYFTEKIHPWGWRLSLGLATLPATLMFLGGLFLPETPNSLVEQGRLEEARRVLEKVRGTSKVDAEFEDLREASEAARAVKHPFRNLLEPRNRPQLVIGALCIPAFQQLSGQNSILFYAPVMFQSLGMGSSASLYSNILSGSMLVLGALVSMLLVDRLGRRFLFIEAGIQMISCMVVVATILVLKLGDGAMLPRDLAIVLVIAICAFVVAYGWSWGPLGWLVPSEIFPLETRSAGQSIVVCVNMFFTAAIAQCFLAMLCHLRWGVFVLFAALIIIMSLFIILLLPETKQVPIEEMAELWERHWYWKRIVLKDPKRKENQSLSLEQGRPQEDL
ncbi:sugar transport protein 14-like [Zingiber officinale]|uniref:sugar transport protein 14-like n=1 Tax=Zingiber officinale TaxID=94328 RepID=UPI001C4C2784|nr:sugar transport protein 14-like [Zingiber officinale]